MLYSIREKVKIMNQRGFGLIFSTIGIFIVLVIIGGAYYLGTKQNTSKNTGIFNSEIKKLPGFSPTALPTTLDIPSNWKSYSSKQYGYSFSFPQNWDILHDTMDELMVANYQPEVGSGGIDPEKDKGKGYIRFYMDKDYKGVMNLNDYVKSNLVDREQNYGKKEYKLSELSIGGKKAMQVETDYKFGDFNSPTIIFIENLPLGYLVVEPALDYGAYKVEFNNIIHSINFLN